MKHYVLTVDFCDPALSEPFETPETRDLEALRCVQTPTDDEFGLTMKLDLDDDGTPHVSCYVAGELEELGEACDECGNTIPEVDGGGLINKYHKESCSLHDPDLE